MKSALILAAALMASGAARASPVERLAYAPVSDHTACSALEAEARIVQKQVIELGSALFPPAWAIAPYAGPQSAASPPGLELAVARGRLQWLRETARDGECDDMPAWHYLEEPVRQQNPIV